MGEDHLTVQLTHCHCVVNFLMSAKCIRELLVGFNWLDVGPLSVWCSYIHRVCIEKNFSDVYGILEPAMLNIVLNETITLTRAKKYIQERLRDVPKLYHLLPYLHGSFAVYQAVNGNRKKATWVYPKGRRQPNSRDCGYYVMKNMFDIVSTNTTESWVEVFNDPKALTEDELYDLRLLWATYFLELYNGH
ncbi:hypothetical protein QL285_094459 [Trifolium repens]|nr:hypothetical protein QL285_094459 [Trifolium repens]